jgi:hypothetical protein
MVSFNVHRIPYITQYIRDQDFAARSSSPSFGSIAVAFSRSMAVRLVLDLAAAIDSLGCIKIEELQWVTCVSDFLGLEGLCQLGGPRRWLAREGGGCF